MSSNYLTHFTHFKQLTQFTELTNKCELYHTNNGRAYPSPQAQLFLLKIEDNQINQIDANPNSVQEKGAIVAADNFSCKQGAAKPSQAWLCLAVHFCNQNIR